MVARLTTRFHSCRQLAAPTRTGDSLILVGRTHEEGDSLILVGRTHGKKAQFSARW